MSALELGVFVASLPCACSPGRAGRRVAAFNQTMIDQKNGGARIWFSPFTP